MKTKTNENRQNDKVSHNAIIILLYILLKSKGNLQCKNSYFHIYAYAILKSGHIA